MERAGDGRGRVEAAVWTGGVETPYCRAGEGPPVLLLAADSLAEGDALFATLSGSFRVIAPRRIPSSGGRSVWEPWLRGLIDGLGLDRPAVVVHPAHARDVARCATVDPGRIRGVVLASAPAPSVLSAVTAVFEHD